MQADQHVVGLDADAVAAEVGRGGSAKHTAGLQLEEGEVRAADDHVAGPDARVVERVVLVRAAPGYGVKASILQHDADVDAIDGKVAQDALAKVSDRTDADETTHRCIVTTARATAGNQPVQLKAYEVLATLRFTAKDVKGTFNVTLEPGSEFADAQGNVIEESKVVAPMTKIAEIPTVFALEQNYPNPFNPVTHISYSLPLDSKVTLTVYNIVGQQVASLVDGVQEAGVYTNEWNAASLASGVYVYRLSVQAGAESFTMSKRLVLLK